MDNSTNQIPKVMGNNNDRQINLLEYFSGYEGRKYVESLNVLKSSLSIVEEALGLNKFGNPDVMFLGGSLGGEPEIWISFPKRFTIDTEDFQRMAKMGIEVKIHTNYDGSTSVYLLLNKRPLFEETHQRIGSISDELISSIESNASYRQPPRCFRFYYEDYMWKTYMYINHERFEVTN